MQIIAAQFNYVCKRARIKITVPTELIEIFYVKHINILHEITARLL